MSTQNTQKITAINRGWQFSRAYKSKKCFASPFVVTYVVPRKSGSIKIGITASKKIGCAVERNRARRIVKAAAMELLKDADGSFDIVFVCRRAAVEQKSTRLIPVIEGQLRRAGVVQ
ncbi:MAG: ribonuclease P protein component [Oscillospiraceae bacterium]